ncbi:hypothetical protein Daus18300_012660 [Diaporthe australafricana]|uniref:Transcription factor domain-containing protein n=1 Tax=Diaporthe australafricana TaxID=127596 RepID=A0ABR3W1W3_9PEZI
MGLHRVSNESGDSDEVAVQAATFWGAFALDQPFVKLRIKTSQKTSQILPRDLCSDAANAIQGLCKSYSQLYTLERTPSFVPYFVLTSAVMHLAIAASGTPLDPEGLGGAGAGSSTQESPNGDPPAGNNSFKPSSHVTKSINQGISDLTEMAPCHHFAEQALNILRYLAKKWNIKVDVDVAGKLKREKEALGQTGRKPPTRESELTRMKDPDYGTRPTTSSLNFFAPDVQEQDYVSSWRASAPAGAGAASTGESAAKTGESMENPLFWPFPMQGRPILPTGDALAEAGFELY